MKEYICKDRLKRLDEYAYGISELIDDFPTVTEVDICKEFAEKLKLKYQQIYTTFGSLTHDTCLAEMYSLLEEMERGE